MKKFNIIILAEKDKGSLFRQTGIEHKALLPVHGKPLLDWVVEAFHSSPCCGHIVVVGDRILDQLASMRYVSRRMDVGLNAMQGILGAAGYIRNNLTQGRGEDDGYLITGCDAVFLTPVIVTETLEAVAASDGELVIPLVEERHFRQAGYVPGQALLPLENQSLVEGIFYYIRHHNALSSLAPRWESLRRFKGDPENFFKHLGGGERSLPSLMRKLSSAMGAEVKLVLSSQPEMGLAVRNPSSLSLAGERLPSPWQHNYKKCMVIYNPESGQSAPLSPMFRELLGIKQKEFELYETQEDYAFRILEYLREYGIHAEARPTEAPGHATEIACQCAAEGFDLVIAVGGDGTINEVVNGLVGSKVILGVIPLGTVNVLGLQMKLPPEIKAACQVIAAGNTRTIDLGKIENRYFVSMAGVGFDAHVVRRIDSRLKRIYGALAFAITAFKQFLAYRFKPILLKIDDQPIPRKGYFVIIGNGKYYAGRMIVATYADISDGYLDVCIFKHKSLFRLLTYFFWMRRGRIDRDLSVEYFQCKKISILKSGRHAVHVDAEYLCKTPVEIRVCPEAITLAV